jgi:hypothetical protein
VATMRDVGAGGLGPQIGLWEVSSRPHYQDFKRYKCERIGMFEKENYPCICIAYEFYKNISKIKKNL